MKATTMLQGMLQMLDFMGDDLEVYIEIKNDDGTISTYPLKSVKSGTHVTGIILTNIDS